MTWKLAMFALAFVGVIGLVVVSFLIGTRRGKERAWDEVYAPPATPTPIEVLQDESKLVNARYCICNQEPDAEEVQWGWCKTCGREIG